MKNIYITEQQFDTILTESMLNEGVMKNLFNKVFSGCHTVDDYLHRIMTLISGGILTVTIAIALINYGSNALSNAEKNKIVTTIAEQAPQPEWTEICNDAVITVYNAKANQCNDDVEHTASMFRLNLNDVASHKIVAVERTFMQEHGLRYGDVIKIEGTYKGKQDGVYQIQDTMNKRFAGQHKVDVLVPDDVTHGGTLPDEYAKIYVLTNKGDSQKYLQLMAPQAPKK